MNSTVETQYIETVSSREDNWMKIFLKRMGKVNHIKKSLCLFLCVLLLPLGGCGIKDTVNKTTEEDVKFLLTADFSSETYPIDKSFFEAEELNYSTFSETQSVSAVAMAACGDSLAVLLRSMANDGDQLLFYDQTGTQTAGFGIAEKLQTDIANVLYIAGTGDSVAAYVSVFDVKLQQSIDEICIFDKSGDLLRKPFLLSFKDESFSVTGISVLQSGEIVLSGYSSAGNVFYVYDAEMKFLFEISGDNLSGKILESNGIVYVDGMISIKGKEKYCFYPVDMSTGKLSSVIDVSEVTGSCVVISNSGKLYAEDTTTLYAIDLSAKSKKTLVDWKEINIDRSEYSYISPICILSEDVIYVLGIDRNSGYDIGKIVLLTRQDSNPNKEKQTLILGGFDISYDESLLSTINSFNQSNDKYRIEVKDYLVDVDWSQTEKANKDIEKCRQQMYLDVLSGKGPDIFYNVGYYSMINSFAVYEANNFLMDLYPLMESDPEFRITDFLPSVVDACTVNGKLCKMPVHFSLNSIDVDSSVTGGISSWTTDEFDTVAASLPSGMQMITNKTPIELLEFSLADSMNSFVDATAQKANFDSEEFYKLLKWAKTYGIKIPEKADEREYVDEGEQIMNGQLACLANNKIRFTLDFSNRLPEIFGSTPDIIGYPSAEKNGPSIFPEELVGISSWCNCPEGAWVFVKYLLADDYQTQYADDYKYAYSTGGGGGGNGFPVRIESLQAMIDLAMDPPDIEREGDDSNAEPIILTQEQADACMRAINSANTLYYPDLQIYAIIEEEVQSYFLDQKSAEEVSALIQNRVQTMIYERK